MSHPLPANPDTPHAADGPLPPRISPRDDESAPSISLYPSPGGSELLPPAAPVDPRVAEALHRLLVSSVQDYAIYAVTADGRIATWNAGVERLKGYAADEVIGHPLSLFYPPESCGADGVAPRAVELLSTGATRGRAEDEGWRLRKDGTRFWT